MNPVIINNGVFFDGGHRLIAYKKSNKKLIPTIDIGVMLDMDWEKWLNDEMDFELDEAKKIVREEVEKKLSDENVGKQFWFEYHCFESHVSCDAELWYRSHQKIKVIDVTEWSHDNLEDRIEDATPRVYKIEFSDGFQCDAWEDELMYSPEEFYRPDPQSKRKY